jgi:hypothetical protein
LCKIEQILNSLTTREFGRVVFVQNAVVIIPSLNALKEMARQFHPVRTFQLLVYIIPKRRQKHGGVGDYDLNEHHDWLKEQKQ